MRCLAFLLCLLAAGSSRAAEPAIIARARAYLGTEKALAAVRSIHYSGHVVTADSGRPLSEEFTKVDVIFQRPLQYRQVLTTANQLQTTVLDGYDAWMRLRDRDNPSNERVALLDLAQTTSLRAEVVENLNFYRGLEATGGSVEDQGPAVQDGIACEKVAFIHGPGIVYIRYFDRATGRMVLTLAGGVSIRYESEVVISGVRFPTVIATVQKGTEGGERSARFVFDHIVLNEPFPERLFAVPENAAPSD